MDYEIVITKSMHKCLDDILGYLIDELDNHQAACKLRDSLERLYSYLEKTPKMFQLCDDPFLSALGYRQASLHTLDYAVIYTISDGKVYVIDLHHLKQNWHSKYKVLL